MAGTDIANEIYRKYLARESFTAQEQQLIEQARAIAKAGKRMSPEQIDIMIAAKGSVPKGASGSVDPMTAGRGEPAVIAIAQENAGRTNLQRLEEGKPMTQTQFQSARDAWLKQMNDYTGGFIPSAVQELEVAIGRPLDEQEFQLVKTRAGAMLNTPTSYQDIAKSIVADFYPSFAKRTYTQESKTQAGTGTQALPTLADIKVGTGTPAVGQGAPVGQTAGSGIDFQSMLRSILDADIQAAEADRLWQTEQAALGRQSSQDLLEKYTQNQNTLADRYLSMLDKIQQERRDLPSRFSEIVSGLEGQGSEREALLRQTEEEQLSQLLQDLDTEYGAATAEARSSFYDRGLLGPGATSDITENALAQIAGNRAKTGVGLRTQLELGQIGRADAERRRAEDIASSLLGLETSRDTSGEGLAQNLLSLQEVSIPGLGLQQRGQDINAILSMLGLGEQAAGREQNLQLGLLGLGEQAAGREQNLNLSLDQFMTNRQMQELQGTQRLAELGLQGQIQQSLQPKKDIFDKLGALSGLVNVGFTKTLGG